LYVVFGSKCNNKPFINLDKLIKDVLDCLNIIQKRNLIHNDIKDDNIVLCDDTYKLIDWGQAGPLDKIYIGDFIYSNPIKWYIRGYTGFISRKLMDVRARFVDKAYERSSMYQEQYNRITEEFKTVINKNSDRKELMKIYKKSFDIFMLGMTFLYKVYEFKLDYEKYKPLIEAMTSLVDPISDPAVAIKLVKEYI
jgi:serine/threonine protein kinase